MSNEFVMHTYRRYCRPRGKILTVSGGKGGTGKTNVAVNLAIALAQRQQRAVVMDADIGLANAEVIMGLKSNETLRLVIEGKRKVSDILLTGPDNIRVVPGVSGLNHLANLDREGKHNVRQAMEDLQLKHDYVIIDTMAGIGPASVAFAVAADEVLLVTTPEPSALVDGYAMVKMIHSLNPEAVIRIVVNMVDDQEQALRAMANLTAASKKYLQMSLEYAGHVLWDPNVRNAVLRTTPFLILYPQSPASRGIRELASEMIGEPMAETKDVKAGFFRRFAQTLGVAS